MTTKLEDKKKLFNVNYIENPSQDELREIALKHTPATLKTAYGNLNKITRNKARKAQWTYIIAPDSDKSLYSSKTIERDKANRFIEKQRKYIEEQGELIAIDGYLGLSGHVFPIQWLVSKECTNIAGMQQVLAFPRDMVESPAQLKEPFKPLFRLIFTGECSADGMPGNQAVIVDLDIFTSYVIRPDYFGESKKGALRMVNEYVYQQGGLVLHAGAKLVETSGKTMTIAIMGLSGTGKTTTTFSKQGDLTKPIQDDMVCLWPDGSCSITENGCFAKTYGLTEESEPTIYRGTIAPSAWIENVYMNEDGTFDFSKGGLTPEDVARWRDILIETGADATNVDAYINKKVKYEDIVDENDIPKDGWDFVVWTQNGRAIIPMSAIKDAADLKKVPPVESLGILNRDEGPDAATPGILRFASPEQAAAYFMLGETSKTSAAGKERGKTRSPFTQPFFPRASGLQAKRFSELAARKPLLQMWLMNTGYIGGDQKDVSNNKALKVKIRHSSAMLEAMLEDKIKWTKDPDFGYEIVDVNAEQNSELLTRVPKEIVNPKLFYEKEGRSAEYTEWVNKMKKDRTAFLEKCNVSSEIIKSVAN